ncbi:hypothetical protein BDW69DRAFT_169839 [Aspergillus filifer]
MTNRADLHPSYPSCGFGDNFCGDDCVNNCDAKAQCGEDGNLTSCPLGVCCSQFGFCGSTADLFSHPASQPLTTPQTTATSSQTDRLFTGATGVCSNSNSKRGNGTEPSSQAQGQGQDGLGGWEIERTSRQIVLVSALRLLGFTGTDFRNHRSRNLEKRRGVSYGPGVWAPFAWRVSSCCV